MKDDRTTLLVMLTVLILAAMGGFIALSVIHGEDFMIPAMLIGGIGATIVLRGPVGSAIARLLEGGSRTVALDEEARVELEELRARVYELEERVDFAERLLARPADSERLPAPPEGT